MGVYRIATARTCGPRPDPRFRPAGARVWDWRKHCEDVHGATEDDYRMNVLAWHRLHAAGCKWRP